MGFFEKIIKVQSKGTLEILILPALDDEPAFLVTVRIPTDREQSEALDRHIDNFKINTEKQRAWWGRKVVVTWQGLTRGNVYRLIPGANIDEAAFEKRFPDGEMTYSPDDAAWLNLTAPSETFVRVINERIDDERQRLRDEAKAGQYELQKNS